MWVCNGKGHDGGAGQTSTECCNCKAECLLSRVRGAGEEQRQQGGGDSVLDSRRYISHHLAAHSTQFSACSPALVLVLSTSVSDFYLLN